MKKNPPASMTLFEGGRFPNLVVTDEGSLVATWGKDRLVSRRSEDGVHWEEEVAIQEPGIHAGGTLLDRNSGDILFFAHEEHPARRPSPPHPTQMYRSSDGGRSWRRGKAVFHPDVNGYVPALHMSEKGTTLRSGRLIRPARVYIGAGQKGEKHTGYNTATYSDDGGVNWHASKPFPDIGTGEGALVELEGGDIYYSSRKQYFHAGETMHPGRYYAISRDGGETWEDLDCCARLPDGPRARSEERADRCYNGHFGMMAGMDLLRHPEGEVLVYSNVDSEVMRERLTVWLSFDRGKTWPMKRCVFVGPAAYSSVAVVGNGAMEESWIYVLFEGGETDLYEGGKLVRVSVGWMMEGDG